MTSGRDVAMQGFIFFFINDERLCRSKSVRRVYDAVVSSRDRYGNRRMIAEKELAMKLWDSLIFLVVHNHIRKWPSVGCNLKSYY